MKKNPFSINFGKYPSQYIHREILTDEIIDELTSDDGQNPCFMLTGTRGTGKTVEMTTVEKEIAESEDWIVVRLNPMRSMLKGLAAKLYDSREYIRKFIDAKVNLSKFGIGINIESKPPAADIESALEIIWNDLKKREKKVLITIDEVSNNEYMREFASSFQIMLRADLPVYLIMAGLYENIRSLKDEKNLTFLYRTPEYDMEPLNITLIANNYKRILNISHESATEMAITTRGYPFAYQALGKYVWDDENHEMSDTVLALLDEALGHYIYEKIWSELSKKDRWYMSFIVQKESLTTAELLSMSKQKKNDFSQYRARLRDKGLINVSTRGLISFRLPRFDVFVKNHV
mgnify:CR=1 FL=1